MSAPDAPPAACEATLDMLGITGAENRATVAAHLVGIAIEYLCISIAHISRPRGRELRDALVSISKSARQIEADLVVLRYGRQTADDTEADDEGEEQRRALFPLAVGVWQRAFGTVAHDWRGGFEDPLAGIFDRISTETGKLAAWYEEDRIAVPTRSQHPGVVRLIVRLADLHEGWTGRRPSASRAGDRAAYQSPFIRLVHAFGPMAGISEPLPVKTIAKALEVYPRLREKIDVISGTDGERDLCQSSSDIDGRREISDGDR